MTPRATYISLMTIVRKEVTRILRIWTQTLLPPLITQGLYFIIFGKFIGSQIASIEGVSYMAFIVPGLVMMAVIGGAYGNVVSSFYGAKFQRNIEELFVSPTPEWAIIIGYTAGGIVRGMAVGILVFVVSMFFVHPHIHNLFIILFFSVFTCACFSLAALINGIFARNFDEVAFFQNFILTPFIYLGGVFYSIHSLPEFWQHVSWFNPLVYMINGFRYGFFGFSDVPVWGCALVVLGLTIALAGINLILFKRGTGIKS